MASEIRVNQIQNRSGLTTTTLNDQGVVVAGIVTANSFSGDISGSSTYADFTGGVGIGTVNGQVTFTGQTDVRKAGAASFVVGSSDASGATIAIDGDSNGDGNGADYAFLTHDTDGDLQIVVDNPSNAGNIVFKTSSATPEKVRIKSDGTLFVRAGNATQGTNITGTSVGVGTTTTAGRNAGVGTANGTLVYNSTDNALEMYANNEWSVIQKKSPFNVSGGTISNDVNRSNFVTHTFTSPGNFISGGEITSAEIFVIGGGGGGGARAYGAGGGAGGAMLATGVTLTPGTYGVSVGSGGAGGTYPNGQRGSDGGNSIFHPGGTQQRQGTGGGGGGCYDAPSSVGRDGGSGGGGSSRPGSPGGSATQPSAPGPGTDYGNRGGNYGNYPNGWAPAGGGGAGAQGTDTASPELNGGGNGGAGVQLSISGTATYYGGGGGGSIFYTIAPEPIPNNAAPANHKSFGGAGGGGTGGAHPAVTIPPNSSPNQNATANTGSGGAGAHSSSENFSQGAGGNGGSGLVIVAYPTVDNSVTT